MMTAIIKKIFSAALLLSALAGLFLTFNGCEPPVKKITITHSVSPGETLSASLIENGITQDAATTIVTELNKVFNLKKSRENDYYEAVVSTSGALYSFSYYPSRGLKYYEIYSTTSTTAATPSKFAARELDLPVQSVIRKSRGSIKTSLWEAMSSDGIEGELIIRFAEIFSSYVDFLTDTREGDEYKVIWEEKVISGGGKNRVIIEKIIAASYSNRGERYTAVGFAPQDNPEEYEYYSPEGKSLRLAFLRAPLSYRRISSYFSGARYHPILRIARPHHGIDYVAPAGTPVSSIGDGTVRARSWHDGYGNLVRIKHPNGYETYYGHLSRFAKISVGSRVRQGQVIGYVGMTGLATGPHLHFEIRQAGRPLNFLKIKLPAAKKIPEKYLSEFKDSSEKALKALEEF